MIHSKTTQLAGNPWKLRLETLLSSRALLAALLVAITGFAALLRFYKLGTWSFWIDEVYNINYARDLWQNFSLFEQPSLILVSLVMRSMGVDHFTARLAPALIGILTIPALYFPLSKMFNGPVALLAVLFIALSPWHLHWSQNSRFYSALMLFYAVSAFLFYFAVEEDSPWLFLASIFFLGLAILERKIAIFWAPVMIVYLAAAAWGPFSRPSGLRRRNLIALGIPVVIFLVIEVVRVAFAGQQPLYMEFVESFIGYQFNPLRVLLSIIYDIGLPLFLVAVLGGAYLLWSRSRAGLFLVINAVLPVAVLVAVSPFTQSFSRYVFLTFPAWVALAAVAVVELYRHTAREGRFLSLAVLFILLVEPLSQDVLYYTYQNGNRENWSAAYELVEENFQSGDRVVTTRVEIGEYYLGEVADLPDQAHPAIEWTQGLDPRDVEAASLRTWFVIDNRTGFVSPELAEWLESVPRLVGVKDVSLPGKTMMMRVYRYDP